MAIDIEHALMVTYGFISVDKLKNEPIPRIFALLERMERDAKEIERSQRRVRR